MGDQPALVLFVCEHGALRSRLAAAFFNAVAPIGWQATSAGIEPQEALGDTALELLKGTDAELFLDTDPPRGLEAVLNRRRTVAIDCEVHAAEQWRLESRMPDETMSAELRGRVADLVAEIRRSLARRVTSPDD